MNQALLLLLLLGLAVAVGVAVKARRTATIYAPMVGLLYRDGRLERMLEPGRHQWWDVGERTKLVTLSRAETAVAVGELTVVSKDQFSFRIGLAPLVAITDPERYQASVEVAPDPYGFGQPQHPALHALVAASAIEACGELTLDELIARPADLAEAIRARIEHAIDGVTIARILLTAINLPPETRKMFTDVERAKREAQAAVERARGEHAALRVLANAARLVGDNPALANLRLLQAIETSKGPTTIVLGPASGLTMTTPT